MRNSLPLAAAFALTACAHHLAVVPAAFAPAPRKIAVLDYETGLIANGDGFGNLGPVREPARGLAALEASLVRSRLFLVANERAVFTHPAYVALPLRADEAGNFPPLARPIDFAHAATPALALALGADLLLSVRHDIVVHQPYGQPALEVGPVSQEVVSVDTRIEACGSDGAVVWSDRFSTNSDRFWTMIPPFGGVANDATQEQVAQALERADGEAVGRLIVALDKK